MPADATQQFVHTFPNGLTLLAERLPNLRSAALTFLVPAGAASDPPLASGAATVLAEWILRGAGSRDSHQLTSYLDALGVQRGTSAETTFLRFSASMLAQNLLPVLPIYADIVQRPLLPDDGFAPAVDLARQQLDALDDEPSQKLGLLLRQQHYDYPFGRPSVGLSADLEVLTPEILRADCQARFTPSGSILAVAGLFDWPALQDAVARAFASWPAQSPVTLSPRPAPRGPLHETQDTNQVQIGLAYDSLPEDHPDAILIQTALNVLSGPGMGTRLFAEIREKQGLCYSVQAGYHSLKHHAAIFAYAASAPDHAQQTLDALCDELARFTAGITPEEFRRAIIGMKSRLIMQGESSSARAAALAYDFYHRHRPRTLAEVRAEVEAVTLEQLNAFIAAHPPGPFTTVTIGPHELSNPG